MLLILFAIMSLALFLLMYCDKQNAIQDKYRIPERTLFLFALCGGAVGGVLGMRKFHHKTKKMKFQILFPVLAVAQIVWCVYSLIF